MACKVRSFLILLVAIIFFDLSWINLSGESLSYKELIQPGKWLKNISVPIDYEGESSSAKIQIYFPKDYEFGKYYRTVIALHQYGERENDWETSTSIASIANKYNMVIVCPSMGRSLYETKYYPETSYKWNIIPGGKFIGETLIAFLQNNFRLATKREGTGIMGVAVGAHGAILVATNYSNKFGAAAGISGFYDHSTMQNSRMVESIYGPYKKNSQRWEDEDNPLKMAENLKNIKVYIYHGIKGDAFNIMQSQLMAIRLKQLEKKDPSYSVIYREGKTNGYGWLYWRAQVEPVMEFMDSSLK
ncbi:MAG TPA: alpha/beta hydrolase-fold protein [Spirochaetota bacterium]|jgi:S-formylglutathione hydrolase FrmB|nr:alpha/beta hydrolase-fold protein [Spirochaetota bacterium]